MAVSEEVFRTLIAQLAAQADRTRDELATVGRSVVTMESRLSSLDHMLREVRSDLTGLAKVLQEGDRSVVVRTALLERNQEEFSEDIKGLQSLLRATGVDLETARKRALQQQVAFWSALTALATALAGWVAKL